MNLIRFVVFAAVLNGILLAQISSSYIVTDDLNYEIEFTHPPERIITLAPNLTEMVYELGVERHLVGNTLFCNYPEEAGEIEKVGDVLTFDYEKIISLSPDLVFITIEGNTRAAYEKFLGLGIKVFVSNPRDYNGIKKTFLDFGKIFDRSGIAEEIIVCWDSIVNEVKNSSQNNDPKTVMFLIEANPIMLAGENTFLNEFISLCGLKNIAAESPINYPVYSREEILIKNPDYIIYPTDGAHTISSIMDIYPEWNNLTAIKNDQVIFLNWDLFSRPGPRFVDALKVLFNRLHL
ncbi:ABC transporter substrate-binding protein [Bacteroidota bacterium]